MNVHATGRLGLLAGIISLLLAWPAHAQRPEVPKDSLRAQPGNLVVPQARRLPPGILDPRVLARVDTQPGGGGLLAGPEYRSLERQLTAHGTRMYDYRSLEGPARQETTRGLLLMRDSRYLRQIGRGFFDDGRGNLVHFGKFERRQASPVSYSLTLFQDGGSLLALDATGNGIADAVVSERLDRFGFLADEDFRRFGDCFERARRSGNPLKAAADCIGLSRPGGGSGGGLSDFADDLLEPDCGNGGLKGPDRGWLTDPEVNESRVREARDDALDNAYKHRRAADEASSRGDYALADAHDRVADDHSDLAAAAQRVLGTEPGTAARQDAYDTAFDALDRLDRDLADLRRQQLIRETAAARRRAREGEGQRPRGTTEPRPDELPGGQDPRCAPKPEWSDWTRRCQENLRDCLTRKDPLSVMTGGQCVVRTGPDDEPGVHCEGNDSMAQCLAAGGSVSECAEETYSHCSVVGPDGRRPEGCEGYAPTDRPSLARGARSDIAFIQISPLGGVIAAICQGAGGTGPCGDPLPIVR